MYQNFNGIYKFIGKLSRMVISLLILLIFNFSLMNLKYLYLSEKNVALFQPSKLKEVTDLTLKELSFPFGFIIGITRSKVGKKFHIWVLPRKLAYWSGHSVVSNKTYEDMGNLCKRKDNQVSGTKIKNRKENERKSHVWPSLLLQWIILVSGNLSHEVIILVISLLDFQSFQKVPHIHKRYVINEGIYIRFGSNFY